MWRILIAAYEVVERPASAVKELTENAIDAGATAVTVEIQRRHELYPVTDNGSGIEPEDCLTAFLRHATSKIRTEFDLGGHRHAGLSGGEALAAIASVSRVELMTRTGARRRHRPAAGRRRWCASGEEVGCPKGHHPHRPGSVFQLPRPPEVPEARLRRGQRAVAAVVQHAAPQPPGGELPLPAEGKESRSPRRRQPQERSLRRAGPGHGPGPCPCKGQRRGHQCGRLPLQAGLLPGPRASQFFFLSTAAM